ncbi:MAG TPA: DUF1800 domain-containing protein [Steroidobacteraceae bacterium]|nr:DUF1800 domain-containing protein [Steroidobacteraceae bacterium]
MHSDRQRAAASAVNRFGLGARPGDLERIGDPQTWLLAQIDHPADGAVWLAGLPSSVDYLRREAQLRRQLQELRREGTAVKPAAATGPGAKPVNPFVRLYRRAFGEDLRQEAVARWRIAAGTGTPFAERLVRFWSNHFAVSVDKGPARLYAAPLEREAIRPHFAGRFLDMLLAVETHPAMLRYLDQAQSVGPDSMLAMRADRRLARIARGKDQPARRLGINENLAREIMELHTLGAGSGYTQADVTEFARALAGWSLPFPRQIERDGITSAFVYRPAAHEPGTRLVLGKRYPNTGFDQARAILADLAAHPATARHLSFELARHFVADDPPPPLVERLAAVYRRAGGQLSAVYAELIRAPESWTQAAVKFRTPQDYVVAGLRAGSMRIGHRPQPYEGLLARLGQPTFMPRSPAGFSDVAGDWIAPDALWKRVQTAEALAERVPRAGLDPASFARALLGPQLRAATTAAIARAEARQQAIAIVFASPEFQWRA